VECVPRAYDGCNNCARKILFLQFVGVVANQTLHAQGYGELAEIGGVNEFIRRSVGEYRYCCC